MREAYADLNGLATPERTTPRYPFVLTTGRSLYEFNAGTMTGRSRTRMLRPSDLLEMSPADADVTELHDGDLVRVASRYGSGVGSSKLRRSRTRYTGFDCDS